MAEVIEHKRETEFTNKVLGNTVFMLLNQQIGQDPKAVNDPYINGANFAEEMYYWKSQGRDLSVKINSPGGKVSHGWNMIDSIIECGAETFNTGIAFSMAGMCLMAGKFRKAYDFTAVMLHAPRGTTGPLMDVVKNQFRVLLETRTKFTKEEVNEMVDSGKDYFFSAQEALKKGIIDEVVPSGRSFSPPTSASAKELCEFYNSYEENQNNEDMDFKDLLAKLTGKGSEAESIVAVTEMKGKIDSLTASVTAKDQEITTLKAKVAELENAGKEDAAKVKAVKLIDDAEKAKKFVNLKAEEKQKFVEMATANYDGVKAMIDSMPSKKEFSAASTVSDDKSKTETYEFLAKNDPKRLEDIFKNDPELFNKLSDEYVASKKEATQK